MYIQFMQACRITPGQYECSHTLFYVCKNKWLKFRICTYIHMPINHNSANMSYLISHLSNQQNQANMKSGNMHLISTVTMSPNPQGHVTLLHCICHYAYVHHYVCTCIIIVGIMWYVRSISCDEYTRTYVRMWKWYY